MGGVRVGPEAARHADRVQVGQEAGAARVVGSSASGLLHQGQRLEQRGPGPHKVTDLGELAAHDAGDLRLDADLDFGLDPAYGQCLVDDLAPFDLDGTFLVAVSTAVPYGGDRADARSREDER